MNEKKEEFVVAGQSGVTEADVNVSGKEYSDGRDWQVPRRKFLQSFAAAGLLNAAPSLKLSEVSPVGKTSKVIDIHAHYYPLEYIELLDSFGGTETGTAISKNCMATQSRGDLDFRFRVMDEAGIDMQVLSVPPQFPYFASEEHGVKAAHLANDLCAELARKYPEKFEVFTIFPLPHMDASLKELARGMDELGMVGAAIGTTVLGTSIADPAFDPLYAELNRRNAILFIHPTGVSACSGCITKSGLTWAVGAPFEDTVCLLQMMSAGIPKRFPNIKIIISHLGGTLPFLIRRLDLQAAQFMPKGSTDKPSELARSFWCDTVNGHPTALRDACDCYGPQKVLLGTDYPYWRNEMKLCVDFVKQIGLSQNEVASILGGTSQQLLAAHIHNHGTKASS